MSGPAFFLPSSAPLVCKISGNCYVFRSIGFNETLIVSYIIFEKSIVSGNISEKREKGVYSEQRYQVNFRFKSKINAKVL